MTNLKTQIENEDIEGALISIHSLKGTTGTLGLANAHYYLTEQEAIAKSTSMQQPLTVIESVYHWLKANVNPEYQMLGKRLSEKYPNPDTGESSVLTYNQQEVSDLFDELDECLLSGNMKALALCEQLSQANVVNEDKRIADVITRVQNLDFAGAKQVLDTIRMK
jgi:HPt (histidine-containing phosphotransfer) domain-containing protein